MSSVPSYARGPVRRHRDDLDHRGRARHAADRAVGTGGFTVLAQRRLRRRHARRPRGDGKEHPPRHQGQRRRDRRRGRRRGAGHRLRCLAGLPSARGDQRGPRDGHVPVPWTSSSSRWSWRSSRPMSPPRGPRRRSPGPRSWRRWPAPPPAPKKTRHLAVPYRHRLPDRGVPAARRGRARTRRKAGTRPACGKNSSPASSRSPPPSRCWPLAPLGVAAAAWKRSPIAIRLALRDLATVPGPVRPGAGSDQPQHADRGHHLREPAPPGSAAPLPATGPNLSSSQLIVYAPNGRQRVGPDGQTAPPVSMAQSPARSRTKSPPILGTTSMVTLETTSAGLVHAAPGPFWSGQIYVATPQLLQRCSASATARSAPTPTSSRCGPACPR